MPTSMQNKYVVACAVAAVGLLATVALVLATGSPSATAESPNAEAESFSVLKPVNPLDSSGFSDKARAWLSTAEATPYSGGKASAVGTTSIDGGEIVVAAVGSNVCAFSVETGASTCGESRMAVNGELFTAAPSGCDGYTVLGIVPDGVTELAVDRGGDGKVDGSIPVTGNVYQADLAPVDTVLSSSDGKVSVDLPLDSYAAMNEACKG